MAEAINAAYPGEYNVLAVDWGQDAWIQVRNPLNGVYTHIFTLPWGASAQIPDVAQTVTTQLFKNLHLNPITTHVIGHSHGRKLPEILARTRSTTASG